MLDYTVPQTAALHTALSNTQILASTKDETVNPVESKYGQAVQALELAFKVAEDHSRKMGKTVWGIGSAERSKVDMAHQLFAIASNDAASTHERQTAYKQAMRALEGVTSIPEKGKRRLEAAIALIDAASPAVEIKKGDSESIIV